MRSCTFLSGQIIEDRAVLAVVAVAAVNELREHGPHPLELGDLAVDLLQVPFGDLLDLAAGSALVLAERQQRPAILDREAERPGASGKGELLDVGAVEDAVPTAAKGAGSGRCPRRSEWSSAADRFALQRLRCSFSLPSH